MLTVSRKARPDFWTSELRCATGRSAIRHLLRKIAIRHLLRKIDVEAVLLPSYVPEGVILPVQDSRVNYIFYRLNADLTPDMDDLGPLVATYRALVIVINYFGFESPVAPIKEIAQHEGCYVLEDCAHALWAKAEHADFALWSLNKFLPVADGAILRSRRREVDVNYPPHHQRLPQAAFKAYAEHLEMNANIAKCDGRNLAADMMVESKGYYEAYYACIRDNYELTGQSQESRMVENNAEWMEREQGQRQSNAWAYSLYTPLEFKHTHLGDAKYVNWQPTASAPALFAYPIICPLPREAVASELLKIGVAAATCIDKWDHIPREDKFSNELHFLAHHLLLPVDSDVTGKDIKRIGECLRSFVREQESA